MCKKIHVYMHFLIYTVLIKCMTHSYGYDRISILHGHFVIVIHGNVVSLIHGHF